MPSGITLGVVFFLFMHDVLFFVFGDEMRHASLGKDMWRSMTRMVMCKKLERKTRQVFQLQLLVLMMRCQRLLASILCVATVISSLPLFEKIHHLFESVIIECDRSVLSARYGDEVGKLAVLFQLFREIYALAVWHHVVCIAMNDNEGNCRF